MTLDKTIKIEAYYRDAGLLERIAANFRRFWLDIKWMDMKVEDNGKCTVYMSVYDRSGLGNLELSLVTLSKMVDINFVEELEGATCKEFEIKYDKTKKYDWGVISE